MLAILAGALLFYKHMFCRREAGPGTCEVMVQAMAERGIVVNVVKQAGAAGLCVSIVSRSTIQIELAVQRLVGLPVSDLAFRRSLSRIQLAGRPVSRALDAWIQVAPGRGRSGAVSTD